MLEKEKAIEKLNEKEIKVYQYILAHSLEFPFMTIRELADKVQVSTTVILNYVKKMGYMSKSRQNDLRPVRQRNGHAAKRDCKNRRACPDRHGAGKACGAASCTSNMSSMDALTSVFPKAGADRNVIKRAESWGHKAIAITDHGGAQSFPNAMHSAKNIKILYGCEGYYVNDVDDRIAVHGSLDASFDDEYVAFDLETTGLSSQHDTIIEIGAAIMKRDQVIDTFQTFVAPGRRLLPKIIELTGITDQMLEGAPSIEEVLPKFLDFVGGRPLCAHNADFDIGFHYCRMRAPRASVPADLCRHAHSGTKPDAGPGQIQAQHRRRRSESAGIQPSPGIRRRDHLRLPHDALLENAR